MLQPLCAAAIQIYCLSMFRGTVEVGITDNDEPLPTGRNTLKKHQKHFKLPAELVSKPQVSMLSENQ